MIAFISFISIMIMSLVSMGIFTIVYSKHLKVDCEIGKLAIFGAIAITIACLLGYFL